MSVDATVTLEPQPIVGTLTATLRDLTPTGFVTFAGAPVLTFRGSQVAPIS